MERTSKGVARHFLSMGLQHWGQFDTQRAEAARSYLKLAGFDNGESAEAKNWLSEVLAEMHRGKFELEVEQLEAAALKKARGE